MRALCYRCWWSRKMGCLLLAGVAGFGVAETAVAQMRSSTQAAANGKPARLTLLRAGDPAPDFTLKVSGEQTLRLSDVVGKKTVLLVFFSVGSDFCRIELPQLQKMYTQYKDAGLEVVAIGVGRESTAELERYWEANRLTFPVAKNGMGAEDVFKKYQGYNVPTHYLIGTDRKVLSAWVGYPATTGAARLKEHLAGAGFK